MSPVRAAALASAVGLIAFCAAFVVLLVGDLDIPMPRYYPVLREWAVEGRPRQGEIVMNWYGRSLYALTLGAAGYACAAAALRRWGKPLETAKRLNAWAAIVLGLVLVAALAACVLHELGLFR